MLGFWCLFVTLALVVSPAVAVGKKRSRDAPDQANSNDGFSDGDGGFFDDQKRYIYGQNFRWRY